MAIGKYNSTVKPLELSNPSGKKSAGGGELHVCAEHSYQGHNNYLPLFHPRLVQITNVAMPSPLRELVNDWQQWVANDTWEKVFILCSY
jgi:hypothetical protein